LNTHEIIRLSRHLDQVELLPHTYLYHEGDGPGAAYLVATGKLEMLIRTPGKSDFRVSRVGPGALIGEMSFMDGGRRASSVRAIQRSRVYGLGRQYYRSLQRKGDPLADKIVQVVARSVCERLRETDRQILQALRSDPGAEPARQAGGNHRLSGAFSSRRRG
jgi:CRP-like cAMP-binding protein